MTITRIISIIMWLLAIGAIIENFVYNLKDHGMGHALKAAAIEIAVLLLFIGVGIGWRHVVFISRDTWAEGIVDAVGIIFDVFLDVEFGD